MTLDDCIEEFNVWVPTGNGRKLSHNDCTAGNFDLPDHGFLLLTCSTAEALTNVLRYHTCRSSLPEDRKLPITVLKWDAKTLTDIPCNNAYWFFAFFWLTKGSRNKNQTYIIGRDPCAHIC